MLGLGGVRLKQGRLDESFDAYQKALANFVATSGPRYFRTGHAHVKLGQHYTLRRRFAEAESVRPIIFSLHQMLRTFY